MPDFGKEYYQIMYSIIPLTRFRPLLVAVAALTLPALTHAEAAKGKSFTLGPKETVSFTTATTAKGAAHFEVTLPTSYLPTPTPAEANIKIVDSKDYVWWSGTLKAGANRTWSVDLPPAGVDAVLIAEKAVISFDTDKAASDAATLTIPYDRLVKQLGEVVPNMHGKPFFFTPSTPNDIATPPAATASRDDAELYATEAERWDNEMQSALYDFDTKLVKAHSLWSDLKTAGRLPWSAATVAKLGALYDNVENQREALHQARAKARADAQAFVDAWNKAHASEPGFRPLLIAFYGES